MNLRHWTQLALSTGVGGTLGTQLFAWQQGYSALLGEPYHYGALKLYTPLDGIRWAWWLGLTQPGDFLGAGCLGLAITGGILALAWKPTPEKPVKAAWATRSQMRRSKLYRRAGVIVGKDGKRNVRQHQPSHTMVVASTQSGKTTCLVVPTILDDTQHSIVATDPKDEGAEIPGGEVYTLTAGYRATMSNVIRFQPLSPTSHQYNPLDSIRLHTDYEIRDLQIVADMLVDPDGEGSKHQSDAGKHFMDIASDIHCGVLAHGLYTRQATNLGTFHQWWAGEMNMDNLITVMKHTRHVNGHCHPAVVTAIRLLEETSERELSSLKNTARRALRLWADPLVCRATARSDFHLRDLREGARPLTLYLNFPFADMERLQPLSRLVIRQCLEHASSRKEGWRYPLIAMLDEFQSLGHFPLLSKGLNYFLGMGVTMCLITPSLHAVDATWGSHHPFMEGCATKVMFGVRDSKVAERFTHSIGTTQRTHTRESWTQGQTRFDGRRSTSTEEREEPLISTTALLDLDENTVLARIGRHTTRLIKAYYKHDRTWRKRSLMSPETEGRGTHVA